jgi:N utilization substance protein A
VLVDDETMEATVVVPDDQLSLAIGKEGLNARLAARLTGWKIDIVSESEFARTEAEAAFGGGVDEEFTGRCAAVLSNGKRCPNTSVPGSRYCGIPAHRELAAREEAGEELDPSEAVPVGGMPEAESDEPGEPEADGEVAADGDDTAEPPAEAANPAAEEEQPAS